MPSFLIAVSWAIVAFLIYRIASNVVHKQRQNTKAKALGCKEPPTLPCADPFGIQTARDCMKAVKQDRFPVFSMNTIDKMSESSGRYCPTFDLKFPPGNKEIFTVDPRNIQTVLALKFKDFQLPELRVKIFGPLLGQGIFASNGERWEHSRALLRPQFIRAQVSDLDLEEYHVQNMIRALPVYRGGWTDSVDVQELFFRLTLDSATEFLFGESVNSQVTALTRPAGDKGFAYAFDTSQLYLRTASFYGEFYWIAYYNKEFRGLCEQVHQFVDRFVQLALSQEKKPSQQNEEAGAKEKYVFLEALAQQTQDPIILRNELLNVLLAGRDTTASLLSWLFMLLGQHPAIFRKLRREISENFGGYGEPKNISFENLKGCTYLQWCLNETLRLFPLVPFNGRQATRDTSIPFGGGPDGNDPIFIPKGNVVGYSVHAMHHRKDLWGPDAEDFKPERWNGRKPGWEYLPFNGGPRICIGQQFALTEAGYVTVRLLQRFDELDGSELGTVRHGVGLINKPGGGVKLRLHVAK